MKILNLFFGKKKKEIQYPSDFALVSYTSQALEDGITDDQNKIIIRYYINRYGRPTQRKYVYSEERVHALEDVHKIPVYDKTLEEPRFPVFAKILPGEISIEK